MPSLWFVVPARGRLQLAQICLRQLRRTCDLLEAEGVRASAVVVADDENLDTARELGFATVERDNEFLGVRFNDGIQLACDRSHNPHPVDYVVPCGSDDWVDHRLFLNLPDLLTVEGFPRLAVVREDGQELTVRELKYPGGSGIRIYPRALFGPLHYRPADEGRKRACDTSILNNTRRKVDFKVAHKHLHDFQIVDWKSPSEQLNSYDELGLFRKVMVTEPFEALAPFYPAEALEEMRALYGSRTTKASGGFVGLGAPEAKDRWVA